MQLRLCAGLKNAPTKNNQVPVSYFETSSQKKKKKTPQNKMFHPSHTFLGLGLVIVKSKRQMGLKTNSNILFLLMLHSAQVESEMKHEATRARVWTVRVLTPVQTL